MSFHRYALIRSVSAKGKNNMKNYHKLPTHLVGEFYTRDLGEDGTADILATVAASIAILALFAIYISL